MKKGPSVPRFAGLSGRLTISAACLHAIVLALDSLRAASLSGELGAPHKRRCFGTQAWQDVAPYSSRRQSLSSPCQGRGRAVSVYVVGDAYMRPLQRISGAPVSGISQTQLASACLREVPPCGTKAGPFLSNLEKMSCSPAY